MSAEADNLVLRLLREMRTDMATKGDVGEMRTDLGVLRHDLGDLRQDVSEGFTRTATALTTLARRLDADWPGDCR